MYPVALSSIEVQLKLLFCTVCSICSGTALVGPGFFISGFIGFCPAYTLPHSHWMHYIFVTFRPVVYRSKHVYFFTGKWIVLMLYLARSLIILLIGCHCYVWWLLLPCLRLLFCNKVMPDVIVAASIKSEGLCIVEFHVQGISIAFGLGPLNESD